MRKPYLRFCRSQHGCERRVVGCTCAPDSLVRKAHPTISQRAMNTAFVSEDSIQIQGGHAPPGSRGGSRLLRRTFIIALILVSGGLLTSGAVELFFRYRESVAGIWALQREMAQEGNRPRLTSEDVVRPRLDKADLR